MNRFRIAAVSVGVGVTLGFLGGIETARAVTDDSFQSSINGGLVKAADHVLQNLLGSAVVSSHEVAPPEPDRPASIAFDIADDAQIPLIINVFNRNAPTGSEYPPGPCRTWFQVRIDAQSISFAADPRSAPSRTTVPPVLETDLSAYPPGPCKAPTVVGAR